MSRSPDATGNVYGEGRAGLIRPAFPTSLDVTPTAKCNLECDFCWGPNHLLPDGLTAGEWIELLAYFRDEGTRRVVFTGGEPLLRRDIGALLQGAVGLGYHVTLSTNTLLLKRKISSVAPWIHEIGIPLDGPGPRSNAEMRQGRQGYRAFAAALDGMALVRAANPKVEITVRTVVSRKNYDQIDELGELLKARASFWDRWKLYQFVAASIGADQRDAHDISDDLFVTTTDRIRAAMPESCVTAQSRHGRGGRYLFVGSEGELYVPSGVEGYRPIGTWRDLREDRQLLAEAIWEHLDSSRNDMHGRPAFEAN